MTVIINWSTLLLEACPISKTDLQQLYGGFEANTYVVKLDAAQYILKIWSKEAKVSAEKQFKLLQTLHQHHISVPEAFGWGYDEKHNPVLLTSYNGATIEKINNYYIKVLSEQLVKVHHLPYHHFNQLPTYDFSTYFFPYLSKYEDIQAKLHELLTLVTYKYTSFIHGDYNLGNVVVNNEQCTIIDWTNGQLGDVRYDIAWSILLMQIYVNEKIASRYRQSFLSLTTISKEDLHIFEAIACLRYILLLRNNYIAPSQNELQKLRTLVSNNKYVDKLIIFR